MTDAADRGREARGPVPQCRSLCGLALRAPDLLLEVHRLSIVEGAGAKAIISTLRPAFAALGLSPPQPRAVRRHLRSHLGPEAIEAAKVASRPTFGKVEVAQSVSELAELERLYARCVEALDRGFGVDAAAGSGAGRVPGARELAALLAEGRQLLARIHAVRTGQAVLSDALRSLVKELVSRASLKIGMEFNVLEGLVAEVPAARKRLAFLAEERLSALFIEAATSALTEARGRLGLEGTP